MVDLVDAAIIAIGTTSLGAVSLQSGVTVPFPNGRPATIAGRLPGTVTVEQDGHVMSTVARSLDGTVTSSSEGGKATTDILNIPVQKPEIMETTAVGVAFLAGMKVGMYGDLTEMESNWKASNSFVPRMPRSERKQLIRGWSNALSKVLT